MCPERVLLARVIARILGIGIYIKPGNQITAELARLADYVIDDGQNGVDWVHHGGDWELDGCLDALIGRLEARRLIGAVLVLPHFFRHLPTHLHVVDIAQGLVNKL